MGSKELSQSVLDFHVKPWKILIYNDEIYQLLYLILSSLREKLTETSKLLYSVSHQDHVKTTRIQ